VAETMIEALNRLKKTAASHSGHARKKPAHRINNAGFKRFLFAESSH